MTTEYKAALVAQQADFDAQLAALKAEHVSAAAASQTALEEQRKKNADEAASIATLTADAAVTSARTAQCLQMAKALLSTVTDPKLHADIEHIVDFASAPERDRQLDEAKAAVVAAQAKVDALEG